MTVKHLLLVGLGGMAGSVLRYLSSLLIKHNSFPYATLSVNLAGSLVIGMVMGYAAKTEGFGNWRLFLATGICGGFTTFSAFAWENMQLLQQHRYQAFLIYTAISILAGLACVAIGYWITR